MKSYCVDTNAILDLCYRYYPKTTFANVWQALEQAITARQIKLYISQHIYDEVQAKIIQFGYDKNTFDVFLGEFNITIIPLKEYEQQLAQLKADIVSANPKLIKGLSNKDQDLSNICAIMKKGGVITSEQGLNVKLNSPNFPTNFKIPDVANYFKVECQNWLPVLEYIGFCE